MPRPLIAIVNSSSFAKQYPEHLARLSAFADVRSVAVGRDATTEELLGELAGAHGIIASVTPQFDAAFFGGASALVILARHGIGVDNVDITAATGAGVVVTNVPGPIERETVAEHTVALMLALIRRVVEGADAVRENRWSDRARFIGIEIHGRTIGIIGFGSIGSRVAEILHHGFGAEILSYDPSATRKELKVAGARACELDELLEKSEIITLNCSLSESSRGMLGAEQFARMRRGVYLINNSRAEVLDETALCDAIQSGNVAGYATDVVENEPIDRSHRLLKFSNVIVIPHLGGYTMESLKGMGESIVGDMEEVFVHGAFPQTALNSVLAQRGLRVWQT